MKKLKYVVFDNAYPVVFGEYFQHSDVRIGGKKATSAGFVNIHEEDAPKDSRFCQCRILVANCYGESISLGVKSDPLDKNLIELMHNT